MKNFINNIISLFSKPKSKGIIANRNFIEQICLNYTDKANIWVSDRNMILPGINEIIDALDKVKPYDRKYDFNSFFCKHFMVTLWSEFIKLKETTDWAIGYIAFKGNEYSHIAVCIMDNVGQIHIINGQNKERRILTKKDEVFYIFI